MTLPCKIHQFFYEGKKKNKKIKKITKTIRKPQENNNYFLAFSKK